MLLENETHCQAVQNPISDLIHLDLEVGENSTASAFDNIRDIVEPEALTVAQALVKTGAYRVDMKLSPDKWYKWKSGITHIQQAFFEN
jgi:hypothetical protein